MTPSRPAIDQSAWPSLRHARGRLLGLPFLLTGGTPALLFGWQACLTAVMLAILASFIVFVPMTALALNDGRAIRGDTPDPAMTGRAYAVLLLLWTSTAWLAAAALQVR
jgi:hypothetical protein